MSIHIINVFRAQKQLPPAVRFTLQELGHRMNAQGYGRVSLTFLQRATGWARSTIQAHIALAIEAGIIAKQCCKLGRRCGINLYRCLLPVRPAQTGSIPVVGRNLPPPKAEEEKSLSLKEEIRRQRWALHNLSLTAEARESLQDDIARLEGLLRC